MSVQVARPATGDDYTAFCAAVHRVCDIDLRQYKRTQMERRIRSFVAMRGGGDLAAYAQRLSRDPAEREQFLDRLTINVSQLWRNPEQWEVIADHVLPDLAATSPTDPPTIRCWSAGCSYGAEVYTLAAIARRTLPDVGVTILGTDIDRRMVERARHGVFSADDARDAPTATLAAHFAMVDGAWHAGPEIRSAVRFEEGDLLRAEPKSCSFDLVLCRNTVIYFNVDVRDALHGRLAASLRPGGRLVVGSTERVAEPAGHGLEPEFPFIYRKS